MDNTDTPPPPQTDPVAAQLDEDEDEQAAAVIQALQAAADDEEIVLSIPDQVDTDEDYEDDEDDRQLEATQSQGQKRVADAETSIDQPLQKLPKDTRSPDEDLDKILEDIEQGLGQSVTELSQTILRNEPALSTTVEALRLSMVQHQGVLNNRIGLIQSLLGPPRSQTTIVSDTQGQSESAMPEIETNSTVSTPLSEKSAKEILRRLGILLELNSKMITKLDFGGTDVSINSTEFDNNRIAYAIARSMQTIGDILQYTYRSKLSTILKNIEVRYPTLRDKVQETIRKAKKAIQAKEAFYQESGLQLHAVTQILQVSPATIFPKIEEAHIRYRLSIPPDNLSVNSPQIVNDSLEPLNEESPAEATMNNREENILIRYGSIDLINGVRTTTANLIVQNISLNIEESYVTSGWVDPRNTTPEGRFIRTLRIDLHCFVQGSVFHQIKIKRRESRIETDVGDVIEAIVSGVLGLNASAKTLGKRVEFTFILPSHLTLENINHTGVRDNFLTIQFSK